MTHYDGFRNSAEHEALTQRDARIAELEEELLKQRFCLNAASDRLVRAEAEIAWLREGVALLEESFDKHSRNCFIPSTIWMLAVHAYFTATKNHESKGS